MRAVSFKTYICGEQLHGNVISRVMTYLENHNGHLQHARDAEVNLRKHFILMNKVPFYIEPLKIHLYRDTIRISGCITSTCLALPNIPNIDLVTLRIIANGNDWNEYFLYIKNNHLCIGYFGDNDIIKLKSLDKMNSSKIIYPDKDGIPGETRCDSVFPSIYKGVTSPFIKIDVSFTPVKSRSRL